MPPIVDKTTKLLLGTVALGVWLNLVLPYFPARRYMPVTNEIKALQSIEFSIKTMASSIEEIEANTMTAADDTNDIATGSCANNFLCQ